MIDIHCHILPGFDDGSSDLGESLDMARIAVSSGVTAIAATPHFRGEEAGLSAMPKLYSRYQWLIQALSQANIPLELYPGAEILCLPETARLAKNRQLPTLGDTNYILVEFFFNESQAFMDQMLSFLQDQGYRPVVAHPERYEKIQQNPVITERWFRRGYVLQVNKGSVLGAFGPRVQQTAGFLLNNGLAHLIASDAHGTRRRTTDMRVLQQWLRDRYDERYVRILLEDNPWRLIRGQSMTPTE